MTLEEINEIAKSIVPKKTLSSIEVILNISNSWEEEAAIESASIGEIIYVEGNRFVNDREFAIIAKHESYRNSEDYGKGDQPDFEAWYDENVKYCLIIKGAER